MVISPFSVGAHCPAQSGTFCEHPDKRVAFTGEGKLVRKATGYEQEKAEAAPSHVGFAGCASRASGAHWSVSVTHRFLRRGIIQDIWESIWKARLIIADVSGRNPNVNYELGLCHALGLPTILLTKRIEDVPFDYRHRRCVIYNTEEARWEERLGEAIEKTIGAITSEGADFGGLRWPYETAPLGDRTKSSGTLSIENPREIILRGVAEIGRFVERAYGPMGSYISVPIERDQVGSYRQGIKLVRGTRSANPLEQNGIEQMRRVAELMQQGSGDGVKTALILAHAILESGHDALSQGYSLTEIIRGMEEAMRVAISSLDSQARPASKADIVSIAQTAAGDAAIASAVVQAFGGAGKDGIITVGVGDVLKPTVSLFEGLRFDQGYISDKFVNIPDSRECVLEDCRLLIYDRKISNMRESLPLLEQVARAGSPLLMIADDVEGEALATLVVNNIRGILRCVAVRAPGTGERRAALLQDIAVLTGGKALTEDVGLTIGVVQLSDLGRAARVVVDKGATMILGGKGGQSSIQSHVNRLRMEISRAASSFEREKLQERLTNLVGRIAAITVGGVTPPEMEVQQYRAESARHATRLAIEEGWVCGGGVSFLNARIAISELSQESEGARAGSDVISLALARPFSALAEIAKRSPTQLLSEIQQAGSSTKGLNVTSGHVEDLVAAGIIDPVKVTRNALRISFSYAARILKTDVWSLGEPTLPPQPLSELSAL